MVKTPRTAPAMLLYAWLGSVPSIVHAATPAGITIPAGELNAALESLVEQTGIQLLYKFEQIDGARTAGVRGAQSPQAAVTALLKGTRLTTKTDSSGAILIAAPTAATSSAEKTSHRNVADVQRLRLARAESEQTGAAPKAHSAATANDQTDVRANAATGAANVVSEELVVVGTRGDARAVADSLSPVDVFPGETLRSAGFSDLSKTLQFLAPAVNYPRSSTAFSSTGTRGVTLRGLTPDQTLILVNGRRRHASSVLNTNNSIGRGTVPVDLNTIPVAAIERIEVLRDGAASQYGSDAIAGVVNIVLRRDDSGGRASVQYGQTERGDGETVIGSLSHGFSLEKDGHVTVTSEVRDRGFTNAAGIDPRFGRVTQRVGDPEQRDINAVATWMAPIGDRLEVFGFVTAAQRDSESPPLFRTPATAPSVYPNGFLPLIALDLADYGASVGMRGDVGSWNWDVSDTWGYDRADFSVSNSVNTSLIASQNPVQTRFECGGSRYQQNVINFLLSRPFENLLSGANLAVGVEHRYENYELLSGEPNSYVGAGAQGLPGYSPKVPIDEGRTAVAGFVDTEISLLEELKLGIAGRFEDYSDFGSELTWKASLFWRPIDVVAFRGTASTGFRAPSLQQQHFSSITSQLDTRTQLLVNVGTFAVDDPVSRALGASPLKAETSRNYSAGVVLTPSDHLVITADVFRIQIDDRIALSESLSGPAVTAVLQANGISDAGQSRFFTNAVDTITKGWEATASWRTPISDSAKLDLSLGYGAFDNELDRLRQNPVLPSLPLLASVSLGTLLDAQIESKLTAAADLEWGRWRLTVNAARFGGWHSPSTPQIFGAELLVDVALGVDITDAVNLRAGAINVTDNFPDRVVPDPDGRPYSEGGGLGGDGREYFVRLFATF